MPTERRTSARSRQSRPRLAAAVAAGLGVLAAVPGRAEVHTAGVPALSSRPGAAYTIYLDFAGFSFTGGWGGASAPGVTPAYDGAVGAFSAADAANIAAVWARVSEKYATLNVNVTTVDPAVAAGQAGTDFARQAYYDTTGRMMHTVIGGNTFDGAAGGVSYVGVDKNTYTATGNGGATYGYHTNWVFTNYLGGAAATKNIGEAASHENGHGLGLDHQVDYDAATGGSDDYSTNAGATGNGSFAPIMGSSYRAQRGLWRNGTMNSGEVQNDPLVLVGNPGMNGFAADGVGHTTATATPLPLAGSVANFAVARGILTPATATAPTPTGASSYTADVFSFNSSGGTVSLTLHDGAERLAVGTADPGPVLASTLSILNAGGGVVATADTSFATLAETVTATNLAPGTYYAQVTSLGGQTSTFNGSTNTYYDMGSYFLTGTGLSGGLATNVYYVGGASTPKAFQVDAGPATNLRTDLTGGTDPGVAPSAAVNLFLGATVPAGASGNLTLGQSGTVNSLSFTGTGTAGATTPVTLGADGNALTLLPAAGFVDANGTGYNPGTGLVVQAGAAAVTVAANLTLGTAQTWAISNAAANPLTVTGVVAGAAAAPLTVTGAGKLVLARANTYAGGTTVSGGTVAFVAGGLGSGPVTLANGGTVQYAAGNTQDLTAGRTFTLAAGGGTVDTNGNAVTFNAAPAGYAAGPLTKAGAGTLTLNAAANPSNLFVRAGTVALGSTAAVTTATTPLSTNNDYVSIGQMTGDNGTLALGGTSTLTVAGDLNVADVGSVGVLNVPAGTTVYARNLYVGKYAAANGTVNQTGGTVTEADNGAAPVEWRIGGGNSGTDAAAVGVYNLSGGVMNSGAARLVVGAYGKGTLNVTGGTAVPLTLVVAGYNGSTGVVNQTGGVVVPSGILFGSGQSSTGNVASGTYTLAGGTLNTAIITRYAQPIVTGTFNFNGGTLAPSGGAGTSVMANLTAAVVQAGGAVFSTPAGHDATVDQTLKHDAALGAAADGGLTKLGAGTLTLDNGSTYTGPTTVTAGTLAVADAAAAGGGTVRLNGGTLVLSGPVAGSPAVTNFGSFTLTQGGGGNAPAVANNVLKLTDTAAGEANAAFTATPLPLSPAGFAAAFTYTPTAGSGFANGLAFVVQNDPRGAAAVGASGGSLGYGNASNSSTATAVANSGAVQFNVYTGQPVGTAFAANGAVPAANGTSPVTLVSGHPLQVTLTYNAQAATLVETIADATSGTAYANTYTNVNFPALVGGTSAYVGFTAGTGGQTATQTVSNFTFANLAAAPVSIANAVTALANTASTLDVPAAVGSRAAAVGPLTLAAGSTVTLSNAGGVGTSAALLATTALSVAPTATLNLGGNDLVVRNGNLAAVTALVAAGYAHGTWAGPGLTSSAAAANAAATTALGVDLNAATGPALFASFDGLAVAPADVLVKYTYYGDANLDGVVNGIDYGRIDAGYAGGGTLTGWYNGDFNYDGRVDGSDYTLIDNAFDLQAGGVTPSAVAVPQSAVATSEVAAVPEPAAVGVAGFGLAVAFGRRRHPRLG